jgi:hypothetical protein
MTQQIRSSARRIVLAISLVALGLGAGCWKPEIDDAAIGCGLDANVNTKCPNRPPVDAAVPATPDASVAPGPAVDGATAIDGGID